MKEEYTTLVGQSSTDERHKGEGIVDTHRRVRDDEGKTR